MAKFLRITLAIGAIVTSLTGLRADDLTEKGLAAAGLKPLWRAQGVLNSSRDRVRHFTGDVDNIYVQSSAGVVTAFKADTGRRLWASQVGLNDEFALAASTNRDTLLITTGPVVNGLNKFTGDQLFSFRLPGQPGTAAAVDDNSLFVPMIDGTLAGISLRTLQHQEKFGTLPAGIVRPVAWRFVSGESVRFPPVAGSDVIALATESGNLHAINARGSNTGKSLYQLLLKSPISAPLTHITRESGDSLLVATADNRLFCIGLTKGARMLWNYSLSGTIESPMIAVENDAFIVSNREGLLKFSLESGLPVRLENNQIWTVRGIRSVAAVSRQYVYAVDLTERLQVIERSTGVVKASLTLVDHTLRLNNGLTDRIFVSTPFGGVVCLAELGSDFAQYHQQPDQEPVMPEVPEKEAAAESPAEEPVAP